MANDLSSLSDEELDAMIAEKQASNSTDLSGLSDDQLDAMIAEKQSNSDFPNIKQAPEDAPSSSDRATIGQRVTAGVAGIADIASASFGDEIEGAAASLIPHPRMISLDGQSGDPEFLDFKGNTELVRRRNRKQKAAAPGAHLTGQVLGGVLSAPAAITKLGLVKGGAVSGGLIGAGKAEGNPLERIDDSAKGAAFGAAAGKVLQPVLKVAGVAINKLRTLRPEQKLNRVDAIILKEVQKRNNVSREDALKIIQNAAEEGPELAFQKLGLTDLAQGAGATNSRSAAIFEKAVVAQQREQQSRISAGVKNIIDTSDFSSLNKKVGEQVYREGSELYKSAFSADFQVTGKLAQLMQRPSMKRATARANKLAADAGTKLEGNELQFFHHAKEALDDMIGSAVKGNKGNQVRSLQTLKNELLSEMDTVPQYAKGRALWAGQKANDAALEFGRKSLKMRAEDVAEFAQGLSNSERQHLLSGVLQNVDDLLRRSSLSDSGTKHFKAEEVRHVFKAVLPEEQANKIVELLEAETLLTTSGRLARQSIGSQTQPRQESARTVQRLSRGPIRQAANLAVEAGTQPIQSAKRYVQTLARFVTREDPAVIEALAIRLAGTPEDAAQAFAKLSPLAQRQTQKVYNAAGGRGAFIVGTTPTIIQDNTFPHLQQ